MASRFDLTARVVTSTRFDIGSAVTGAIGGLKGPIHGGAPTEVVNQLHEMGTPEQAERWIRDAVGRGERIMGFGHRVYRAYDPRAAALRSVAAGLTDVADWLDKAVRVEDIALRVLAELKPNRVIKTNVEYYAAAVLQGVGLPPDLFPATFALARHVGWTANCLEQAAADRVSNSAGSALRGAGRATAAELSEPPLRRRCSAGLSVSASAWRAASAASPGRPGVAASSPPGRVKQGGSPPGAHQRVELRERGLRPGGLGQRHRAVQGHDRRLLQASRRS